MEEEKHEIRKQFIFNGKDFNNWKFRVEILLREHNVEDFIEKSIEEFDEIKITNLDDQVSREAKEKLKRELKTKERKCFSLIVQRIGNDFLEYVKDKANPKEAWKSLCGAFERKGVSNRMFLRRELLTLKMKENDELEGHLLKFDKILRSLKSVGAKIEEEDIICQLLLSLPGKYDSVVTALETMKAEELTMEFVKGRLLDCETKRKTNTFSDVHPELKKVNEDYPTAMAAQRKKSITCFSCGKPGHYRSQCPENANRNHCTNCSSNRAHYVQTDEKDDRTDLPKDGPEITGEEIQYQIGDVLNLNCTSGKAHPAPLVEWLINDVSVTEDLLVHYPVITHQHGLLTKILGLQLVVDGRHFKNGEMRIKCVASVSPVLLQNGKESIVQRRPQTVENRQAELLVRSSSCRHFSNSLITSLIIIKVIVIFM